MSASPEELQKALDRLEAEKRGRDLGFVGAAAAVCGEWLSWIRMPGIALRAPEAAADDIPAASLKGATRETYTTTYQRVEPQAREERPEPERWEYICVTVQDPTEVDPGAIEVAQYAVAGDEVLIADLDGRTMGVRRLGPDDDPAVVARRLLRERRPKRSGKLVFPNMGVA